MINPGVSVGNTPDIVAAPFVAEMDTWSASYTLDSGFVPIIAQSFQPNVASTPTPTPAPAPTATPVPNVWDAPSTSGWGLAVLAAGMLVVLVITLRLTSGSRRTT